LNGQKNVIFVSGGSAFFLNTASSISYQRNLYQSPKFSLNGELNYGFRTEVFSPSDQKKSTFNFRSLSIVGLINIKERNFFELNIGASNITENDKVKNVKLNYTRLFVSLGVLWYFKKINFRIGFSNQEMIHLGLGFHF